MHDGTEVVGTDIVTVSDVLVKIVRTGGIDVRETDLDESVAVLAALLVPQSQRVGHFVDDGADRSIGSDLDVLTSTAHTDR